MPNTEAFKAFTSINHVIYIVTYLGQWFPQQSCFVLKLNESKFYLFLVPARTGSFFVIARRSMASTQRSFYTTSTYTQGGKGDGSFPEGVVGQCRFCMVCILLLSCTLCCECCCFYCSFIALLFLAHSSYLNLIFTF